ncbi:hypothetical protein [Janthinobacterium sp. GW458P]|uniref:hypothetical protein n=1 Tax=Janthinobacterium sp. GW458P TaxID=1981504 RepID=UPI001121E86D|nr:hypothetical protein [Janthinobacterium sp. GW458P]
MGRVSLQGRGRIGASTAALVQTGSPSWRHQLIVAAGIVAEGQKCDEILAALRWWWRLSQARSCSAQDSSWYLIAIMSCGTCTVKPQIWHG